MVFDEPLPKLLLHAYDVAPPAVIVVCDPIQIEVEPVVVMVGFLQKETCTSEVEAVQGLLLIVHLKV